MSVDNPSNVEDVNNNVTEPTETEQKEEKVKTVPLSELLNERKKRQEYEKKLREIEEADNLKKGNYEELLGKYKSELDTLKAAIAEKEVVAEKWNNYEMKQREQYKTILGDVPDVDKMSLEQLEFLASKLKNKVPDTDTAPPKLPNKSTFVLSEKDKKRAREMFSQYDEKDAFEAYIKVMERIKK